MAEDNPVTAPEAERVDNPETDVPAAGESTENVNATDEKEPAPTDNADATEPQDEETNGTPAAAAKASKNRRRSSGVGGQKLNRKKSQNRITQLDAKPGDMYLARLSHWPPWPSIICDDEMLPAGLKRPVTTLQEDGAYHGEYADGGKRVHERTFPVLFFGSNEFSYVTNTLLTPLDPADCKGISEKSKSQLLLEAYRIAAEGHDLQYFKDLLQDHEKALEEEREEAEREEAEKAKAKAEKAEKKTKRKSKAAEPEVETKAAAETPKAKAPTKKRKKDETEADADKPAQKLKLSTPKAPAEEKKKAPASKAKKAAPKKGKAAAAAAATADAEEEAPVEAQKSEPQTNPDEVKSKKSKEILFLRHKLQKGFISRDQPPKEDEMATMGTYFDKLEKHADLEVAIIRATKINKVLKMIVKLNSIPRDEEFNFRHRAMTLLSGWKNILDSDAPAASADKEEKSDANGAGKDEESAETPKQETEEEKTADDTPMPDADSEKAPAPQEEAPEESNPEKK